MIDSTDKPYDGFRTSLYKLDGISISYIEYHLKDDLPDEWYDLFEDPPKELCDRIVEFLNKEYLGKC
jgi:hypothetical protein